MVKHAVCVLTRAFQSTRKERGTRSFKHFGFTLDSSIKIHMVHFLFFNSKKPTPFLAKENYLFVLLVGFWIFLQIRQMSSCIFLLLCSTDGVHMQIGDFLINTVALGNICKYCNNALVRNDVVTHWDHTHKSKTPCLDTPGKMAWHGLEQALREGNISNMMGK